MLWLIVGIVLGLVVSFVIAAARSGRLAVRWYQWPLALIAVVFLMLALQNYMALQDELEFKMASFSLAAFGLPGLLFLVLTFVLPSLGGRGGSKAELEGKAKMA